jgi:hypothetical protein
MDLKPESGWTQKALNVLVEINKRFPELSKYIEEMPDTFRSERTKEPYMKVYYESLLSLLTHYAISHKPEII